MQVADKAAEALCGEPEADGQAREVRLTIGVIPIWFAFAQLGVTRQEALEAASGTDLANFVVSGVVRFMGLSNRSEDRIALDFSHVNVLTAQTLDSRVESYRNDSLDLRSVLVEDRGDAGREAPPEVGRV